LLASLRKSGICTFDFMFAEWKCCFYFVSCCRVLDILRPARANSRSEHEPTCFDQERANVLLQQFLLDQAKKDLDGGQSTGSPGATSARVRLSGQDDLER
jgi:hypothetical protein